MAILDAPNQALPVAPGEVVLERYVKSPPRFSQVVVALVLVVGKLQTRARSGRERVIPFCLQKSAAQVYLFLHQCRSRSNVGNLQAWIPFAPAVQLSFEAQRVLRRQHRIRAESGAG